MDQLLRDVDFKRSFDRMVRVNTTVSGRPKTEYAENGDLITGFLSSISPREMVAYQAIQQRVTHELVAVDETGLMPVAAVHDMLKLDGVTYYVQQVMHPLGQAWVTIYRLEERRDLP
jgi:hypothetical protein